MSRRDDTVALRHMLDHARAAVRIARGRARADLDRDEMVRLALTRAVEVIGEAAARLAPATCQKHPHVPWQQIIATRNRLIHGYDAVDLDVLWTILQRDLPTLVAQLEEILGLSRG